MGLQYFGEIGGDILHWNITLAFLLLVIYNSNGPLICDMCDIIWTKATCVCMFIPSPWREGSLFFWARILFLLPLLDWVMWRKMSRTTEKCPWLLMAKHLILQVFPLLLSWTHTNWPQSEISKTLGDQTQLYLEVKQEKNKNIADTFCQ